VLCNVLILGDVEISEHLLEIESLDRNSSLILLQDTLEHLSLLLIEIKVLAASFSSSLVGHSGKLSQRILLNAILSEC